MTDTIINRETVEQVVDKIGIDLTDGMGEAFAFTGTSREMLGFFIELAQLDADLATNLADGLMIASWPGLVEDSIWYFPGFILEPVAESAEPIELESDQDWEGLGSTD